MFKNQITLKKITFSKEKKGLDLLSYIRRICTYFYHQQVVIVRWCWKSVVNHVQNIHKHDGQLYVTCLHSPLEETRTSQEKARLFTIMPFIGVIGAISKFFKTMSVNRTDVRNCFFFTLYIYCWMKNVLKCCINSLLETILFPRQFKKWTLNSHFTWI